MSVLQREMIRYDDWMTKAALWGNAKQTMCLLRFVFGDHYFMKMKSGELLFSKQGSKWPATTCAWASWAPFWEVFCNQKTSSARCTCWCDFWCDVCWFFTRCWEGVWMMIEWFLVHFSKQRFHELEHPSNETSTFSKFRDSAKSMKTRFENGTKNNIEMLMHVWWIVDEFWSLFGFSNWSKSRLNSGSTFRGLN